MTAFHCQLCALNRPGLIAARRTVGTSATPGPAKTATASAPATPSAAASTPTGSAPVALAPLPVRFTGIHRWNIAAIKGAFVAYLAFPLQRGWHIIHGGTAAEATAPSTPATPSAAASAPVAPVAPATAAVSAPVFITALARSTPFPGSTLSRSPGALLLPGLADNHRPVGALAPAESSDGLVVVEGRVDDFALKRRHRFQLNGTPGRPDLLRYLGRH